VQYAEPSTGCPPLPGIEDILVVMKTGVTEARQKVPIHFKTTLSCIPHYVIYSDFEEEIEGVKIYDALSTIDSDVKVRVQDFDIYNRIAGKGRKGLEQQDFADEDNTNFGKPNNPGWKLDKWKFLPMAQEALKYKPDAKWFVFMEADTYLSWPTLLTWLAKFDHTQPHYLGTETQIADVIFAHGGSGFMLSNPALTKASEQYETRRAELDDYTDAHWAGDCVLGKVLADAGVNLHFSWPILQNSNLGELDEFTTELYRQPWCYIAVALHHLKAEEIEDLWKYEQKRWHEVSALQSPRHTHVSQANERRKTNASSSIVTFSASSSTPKSPSPQPASIGTTYPAKNNPSQPATKPAAKPVRCKRPACNSASATTHVSLAATRALATHAVTRHQAG
jgi:hypothetical protein